MYLNRPAGGDTVSEVAGVEVALQAADGEDELRGLDLLLDVLV